MFFNLLGLFISESQGLIIQKSFLVIGDYKKIRNRAKSIFLMRLQYFPPFFSPIQSLPELMLEGPRTDVLRTDRTRRQTSIRRYLSVGDLTEILTVRRVGFLY